MNKANQDTTLSTILRELRNLTEQQRVGVPKRQNLADQVELLNKDIQ